MRRGRMRFLRPFRAGQRISSAEKSRRQRRCACREAINSSRMVQCRSARPNSEAIPVSRTTEPNCQMQTDAAASCLKDRRSAAAAKAVDASAASPIVTNGAMGAPRLTIYRINTAAGMLMARMVGRQ